MRPSTLTNLSCCLINFCSDVNNAWFVIFLCDIPLLLIKAIKRRKFSLMAFCNKELIWWQATDFVMMGYICLWLTQNQLLHAQVYFMPVLHVRKRKLGRISWCLVSWVSQRKTLFVLMRKPKRYMWSAFNTFII